MASLIERKYEKEPSRWMIEAYLPSGKRLRLSLGSMAKSIAETAKFRIQHLIAAMQLNAPLDPDSIRWLSTIDDFLHDRLAHFGLVRPRVTLQLGDWFTRYLADLPRTFKPGSRRKLEQTQAKLLAHFTESKQLRAITHDDAAAWRRSLEEQKLSEATIRTHCGNARTIMNRAVKRDHIERNAFADLPCGSTARKNPAHVSAADIQRIIDACPTTSWKLLFAVAGYLGVRVPSEYVRLTWDCVDVERSRLRVDSPKTEAHAGGESRIVPLPPYVMSLIQQRYDEMANGERLLIPIKPCGGMRRKALKIIKAAKFQQWPNLWQTLRASCERNMMICGVPDFAVHLILGHSPTVSRKHYANMVPDQVMMAITNGSFDAGQNPGWKALETAGNDLHGEETQGSHKTDKPRSRKHLPAKHAVSVKGGRGDSNPRPSGSQPDALTN